LLVATARCAVQWRVDVATRCNCVFGVHVAAILWRVHMHASMQDQGYCGNDLSHPVCAVCCRGMRRLRGVHLTVILSESRASPTPTWLWARNTLCQSQDNNAHKCTTFAQLCVYILTFLRARTCLVKTLPCLRLGRSVERSCAFMCSMCACTITLSGQHWPTWISCSHTLSVALRSLCCWSSRPTPHMLVSGKVRCPHASGCRAGNSYSAVAPIAVTPHA
jgi:hypothetical protein